MNRIIKFRAWDKKKKKMRNPQDWELGIVLDGTLLTCYNTGGDFNASDEKVVLMQFTGLTDKNGKEIYEGDIIRLSKESRIAFDSPRGKGKGVSETGIVGFYQGQFMYGRTPGHPEEYNSVLWMVARCEVDYGDRFLCKVVGNVYENPELLEK
jgi:uncharacterized phage protein (TIGR01671 family)